MIERVKDPRAFDDPTIWWVEADVIRSGNESEIVDLDYDGPAIDSMLSTVAALQMQRNACVVKGDWMRALALLSPYAVKRVTQTYLFPTCIPGGIAYTWSASEKRWVIDSISGVEG